MAVKKVITLFLIGAIYINSSPLLSLPQFALMTVLGVMTETGVERHSMGTETWSCGAEIAMGSSLAEFVYHNAGGIVGSHLVAQPALHLGIALEHGGAVGSAREDALQM